MIGFGLENEGSWFFRGLYFTERLEQLTLNTGFSPSSLRHRKAAEETVLDTLKNKTAKLADPFRIFLNYFLQYFQRSEDLSSQCSWPQSWPRSSGNKTVFCPFFILRNKVFLLVGKALFLCRFFIFFLLAYMTVPGTLQTGHPIALTFKYGTVPFLAAIDI